MVSTSLFGSRRFGAWLSLSLVSLGLLALAWPVRLEFQTAPGSFRALRLFWQANPSERLLNSPVLYGDRVFGRALLDADRSLPLDAVLTLSLLEVAE